ncbi:MAG: ECF transporter S component [Mycoplasmatales bacterium]|nr:ECF transporter S component [Mycoplasmatales bacterium]
MKNREFFLIKPRTIAFLGVYVAIFIIMTFVPQVGYIRIGPFNATMMAIPVTLATIHYGWKGAIFGIVCFIISSIIGTLFFTPPIIAFVGGWGNLLVVFIIGRLLILIPLMLVLLVASIMRKKVRIKNSKKIILIKYIYAFILGLIISIFNTLFVASLIYIYAYNYGSLKDSYWVFIFSIGINIIIEWTVPPLIAMMVSSLGFYLEQKEKSVKKDRY